MVCLYCGGQTYVTNSREQKRLGHIWRRRACKRCGAVFTTIESADLSLSLSISHSNGQIEPFNRDTLFISLVQALGHRSDAIEAASALAATTIARLLKTRPGASIEVAALRAAAHSTLQRFDKVAAISYAAYHKA